MMEPQIEANEELNVFVSVDEQMVRKRVRLEHVKLMHQFAFVRQMNDVVPKPREEDRFEAAR